MSLVIKVLLKVLPRFLRQRAIAFCRNRGLVFCRKLVPLSVQTLHTWSQLYAGRATTAAIVNKSWVDTSARCLPGDELSIFAPELVKTEHVYLDLQNSNLPQQNRCFSLRNNHLIDDQRNVLYEPDLTLEMLPIAQQILDAAPRIQGTVAYLSNTDINNYYHWLGWILPQLAIYKQFVDLKEIDYFYLGRGVLSAYMVETLALFGISRQQILQTGCTPDRILATVARRTGAQGGGIDHTTAALIRGLFAEAIASGSPRPRRRLYVMRGNVRWRRVLNETEVINALLPYGFEPVAMDGKSVADQARLFADAEAVVAVHGAALANLMFATKGARVLELFPYDYSLKVYYLLASYAQADYYYMIGDRIPTQQQGNRLDISVNVDKLKALCALAGL